MKRTLFWLVLLLSGLSMFTARPTLAQNSNPCVTSWVWYYPDPLPLGASIIGPGPGLWSYIISGPTTNCSPPPCIPCGFGRTPGPVGGSPIAMAGGDTFIKDTDITIPGLGGGLQLQRTWNSILQTGGLGGMFGSNWISTYEETLGVGPYGYVQYVRSDGSIIPYALDPTLFLIPFIGVQVVEPPPPPQSDTYALLLPDGSTRVFSVISHQLLSISDRNGNTTNLTYDNSNRLVTVTSPGSQHIYFNYQNNSPYLVSSVSTDFGATLSYSYDSQRRLSQVTKPDLTTITYVYNALSQITQVIDSNGKILESHTYDSTGRGLTSSQANGVNAMTVSYPQ